ncbi:MAG: hypothetical protein ACE5JG_03700 [Planctomycetota bacterium]
MLSLLLLAACGAEESRLREPAEDYVARLEEARWKDLQRLDVAAFVDQLAGWLRNTRKVLPEERFQPLQETLVRLRPPPAALRPLLAARPPPLTLDDPETYNRDLMAYTVVVSFLERIRASDEPRVPLIDTALRGGLNFTFDPLYGDGPTRTGRLLGRWLSEAPLRPETADTLRRLAPALMARWRKRVSESATSTTFGILFRHLGAKEAAALIFAEWKGMGEEERVDVLERIRKLDDVPRPSLAPAVQALLDPSFAVRASAHRALRRHGAPLRDLDPSARERDIRRALPDLRRWTAETDS